MQRQHPGGRLSHSTMERMVLTRTGLLFAMLGRHDEAISSLETDLLPEARNQPFDEGCLVLGSILETTAGMRFQKADYAGG